MKKYDVSQLAGIFSYLRATEALAGIDGDGIVPWERKDKHHRPNIEAAKRACEVLELSASVRRCSLFLNALNKKNLAWLQLKNEAEVLFQEIQGELRERVFAFVPTSKAAKLTNISKEWAEVWTKFPSCKQDVERAVDCYALEQDTASVFHMMRVSEIGLRSIAKKVGVKLIDKGKRQPIEYATWDKVIQGVNSRINAARALPHGPRKNKNLQFYSQAADQLVYIRDTWRNEVSHTRKSYNDGEAVGVIARVRDFMELLAQR
jgi:hypothetical protein